MNISTSLDRLHLKARQNKWLWYFAIFCRVALAAGFIPSGFVKIMGERFTVLAVNHPMGNFLEAIYHTGYYYTVIGVMQVLAAILLLFPRTAILGVFIYFPIILNICILSLAVRFDGSLITSPLMVLACLYLLCWYYHKWKFILPFNHHAALYEVPGRKELSSKFPVRFFAGVATTFILVVTSVSVGYDMKPRNTMAECITQCPDSANPQACYTFCESIHQQGKPLNKSLDAYYKAINATVLKK
ncbi:DoxX family protein [Pontibacter sp. H259]|uniref:DoxX family protein n=1 Tax=Pontibacter sp. H259 TaxID=3133421 RepID=UPI0030BC1CE6